MRKFSGSDFEITVGEAYRDESTYAFTFAAGSGLRPSVVVKTVRVGEGVELAEFAGERLAEIREALPGVELVRDGASRQGEWAAHETVYEFGDERRRLRQMQRYLLLEAPLRVVTLTATAAQEAFPYTEALFEAVFASYRVRQS